MKLFTNKKKLQREIKNINNISFVPTMGALHKGHESIIRKSVKGSGKTLVSIFVNPKQFNNKRDLNTYPRNNSEDVKILKKLKEKGVFNDYDIVFVDTPPTMSSLVQEAIVFSDYYLIPTKAEFLAIEGVGQAMEFANTTLKSIPNTNPVFLGVLLNQIFEETESHKDFVSELNEILGEKLLKTKIPHKTEIAESPLYAKTVIDFNEDGELFSVFSDLAEEIKERIGLNEKTP